MSKTNRHNDEIENLQRPTGAAKRFAAPAVLFLLLLVFSLTEGLTPLNTALLDLRFKMLKHDPSGTLVVIEIDPKSLREEDRWPWPRDRYAAAITNLQDAGAQLIAFDVDFSSLSDEIGDDAFVEALARRPGEVVLPVFWQWSSRSATDGEMIKTPPHEKFLNDVTVASVTLTTEGNGVVRHGWRGVNDDGVYRASIASVLAGAAPNDHSTFLIDYSIRPNSISRVSFRDVLNGSFPAESIRGKNVLIGATALELGDEFAAPVYGVLPGVMFHALSYESTVAGRTLVSPHPILPLLFGSALLLWLTVRGQHWHWRKFAAVHTFLFIVAVSAPILLQSYFPISFDVGAILAAQLLGAICTIATRLREYARQVIRQRAAMAHYQALTSMVVHDNTDGVIVADDDGYVELANDQARILLGTGDALFPGALITEALPNFPVCAEIETGREAEEAPNEYDSDVRHEYISENNSDRILEIAASRPLSRPETAGRKKQGKIIVYTLRDISARKRTEAAEREAKEAAIAANKIKSQLISNMSHELRTPLNGVIGFADILQKESFGPLGTPEYKEYGESIYSCGKRLLTVVNDMLFIAKLDSGDYEICKSEVSLSDLVESSVCKFEAQAEIEDKSLKMSAPPGIPAVSVDVSVVNEVIAHLLSNAFKYTPPGAHIDVRACKRGHELVIEVEDDGCGVAAKHLPHLTEAFYQADAELNRKYEGAGLGLYVVSRFVELHEGCLSLESSERGGFLARVVFNNAFVGDAVVGAAAA